MRLRKSPETVSAFFSDKNRQIILVDLTFRIVIIFPDKTAIVPVFRDRRIPDHLFILIHRIKIKHKNSAGIKIIIHQ